VTERFTSTDGYTFTSRFINFDPGGHAALGFLNGRYFISGDNNGIAVSTDGDNFVPTLPNHTGLTQDPTIKQFATGNGIIVGLGTARVVTSADQGQTWTDHDDFFGYGMAGGPSFFLTVLF